MDNNIDTLLKVAKYLILSNSIKEQEESITYILCHKFFFDGEEFKKPKAQDQKVQEIIRNKENNKRFICLLDSLEIASKKVQVLTYRDQKINALPTAHIEWEHTQYNGKYAHLSYGNNKYRVEGFSSAECMLLSVLYTAFVLIEYNI